MTDIIYGERQKKILRMLLKAGQKFLKLEAKVVDENLQYAQNPVVKNLNSILLIAAAQIDPKWQKDCVKQYGQAGLWTIIKDTAYRDTFFWMLDQILQHADELREMLKPYVKPPEEWTPNQWHASRKISDKLKKEGKISKDNKSLEESIYTPNIQNKRHEKLLKKKR